METMRLLLPLCTAVFVAGCAQSPAYNSLGYGDYVALTCDRLGEEAVRLMRAGAADYMTKTNFKPDTFERGVYHAFKTA